MLLVQRNRGGVLSSAIITSLEMAYAVNQVGRLTVEVSGTTLWPYLKKHGRILVLRTIPGSAPYVEGQRAWQIVRRQKIVGERGVRHIRISAVDGNDILRRRIVDYSAGSANTSKTDYADDMCKDIVRENFVSATDTTRNLDSSLFGVMADVSAAASISKSFTRRNVLTTLQEIAEASRQAGTYLAFDTVWTGSLYEFRTYTGQRGVDHTADSGDPVFVGPDFGNLTDVEYEDDWEDEITRVIAGGQGEGAARQIARATDSTRAGESPFGLSEDFAQENNTADSTQLADEADAALRAGRPRRIFGGKFVETPGTIYGLHFGFGDIVPAQIDGEKIDCRIDAVHLSVQGGKEDIDIRLRSET